MKRTAMKATLLAAMTGISASEVGAADYRQNPFTLVYEGAITKMSRARSAFTRSRTRSTVWISPPMFTPRQTTIRRRNILQSSWPTRTAG